jgi:hypothetical protein
MSTDDDSDSDSEVFFLHLRANPSSLGDYPPPPSPDRNVTFGQYLEDVEADFAAKCDAHRASVTAALARNATYTDVYSYKDLGAFMHDVSDTLLRFKRNVAAADMLDMMDAIVHLNPAFEITYKALSKAFAFYDHNLHDHVVKLRDLGLEYDDRFCHTTDLYRAVAIIDHLNELDHLDEERATGGYRSNNIFDCYISSVSDTLCHTVMGESFNLDTDTRSLNDTAAVCRRVADVLKCKDGACTKCFYRDAADVFEQYVGAFERGCRNPVPFDDFEMEERASKRARR